MDVPVKIHSFAKGSSQGQGGYARRTVRCGVHPCVPPIPSSFEQRVRDCSYAPPVPQSKSAWALAIGGPPLYSSGSDCHSSCGTFSQFSSIQSAEPFGGTPLPGPPPGPGPPRGPGPLPSASLCPHLLYGLRVRHQGKAHGVPVREAGHFVRSEYRIDAIVPAERDHGLVGFRMIGDEAFGQDPLERPLQSVACGSFTPMNAS